MDNLGDRMKGYERANQTYLTKRLPVIIRVDGVGFHKLGQEMEKPFDTTFNKVMTSSIKDTAKKIQGFKLAYTQSDEVSFLITDYDTIKTESYYNYKKDKIVSIVASMMTCFFNQQANNFNFLKHNNIKFSRLYDAYFDARVFNIPKDDIANYFLWRVKDWKRNSIQMYARSFFSHKKLHKCNSDKIHEMLHTKNKNWTNDLLPYQKNGTFIKKIKSKITEMSPYNYYKEETNIKDNYYEIEKYIQDII